MGDTSFLRLAAMVAAVPVMIFCCGGGLAIVGSVLAGGFGGSLVGILAGALGVLSGPGALVLALIAGAVGAIALTVRRQRRAGQASE